MIEPPLPDGIRFDDRLQLFLTWENRDKDGELLSRKTQRCHSYVLAMLDFLYIQMDQAAGYTAALTTAGVGAANSAAATNFKAGAPVTTSTYGIVVGTDNTAVTIADYSLGTQIAHGVGAGQLQYGAMTINTPLTSGTTRYFTMSRPFTNASGGGITVQEVGIYCTDNNGNHMMERSLSTNTINDAATGTATYTLGVTV